MLLCQPGISSNQLNMKKIEKDVVVIGGGISGLAIAYRLQKLGFDVQLLEKNERLGGVIQTEQNDGFLIDCGPNSTLETSPEIRDFVDELGLTDARVYANEKAKRRYILRNGTVQPLPMNPPQFLTSKLFRTRAKLRLLAEPFVSPAPPEKEETIAEFVTRRVGREFLDYAVNPFIAGVYAGSPERLSVRSAVAKIYALEKNYGSLIKGAIKGAKERKKRSDVDKTRARLFSFQNGMSSLVEALSKHLGTSAVTGASITDLQLNGDSTNFIRFKNGAEETEVISRTVVFTTPSYFTSNWLEELDPTAARALKEITYAPVVMVYFGFREAEKCRPLDGFGFLVPEVEKRKILGTIWSSTIFPSRAPEGGIALTTFVGGVRQPELTELDDIQIVKMVRDELQSILDLQGAPDIVKVKRWQKAIPQYELGHEAKMQKLETFEKHFPGIIVAGNFRNGISVGDCIVQSSQVAKRISEVLQSQTVSQGYQPIN